MRSKHTNGTDGANVGGPAVPDSLPVLDSASAPDTDVQLEGPIQHLITGTELPLSTGLRSVALLTLLQPLQLLSFARLGPF